RAVLPISCSAPCGLLSLGADVAESRASRQKPQLLGAEPQGLNRKEIQEPHLIHRAVVRADVLGHHHTLLPVELVIRQGLHEAAQYELSHPCLPHLLRARGAPCCAEVPTWAAGTRRPVSPAYPSA